MSRRPGSSNTLRLIGGRFGGRRLRFADSPGLRPTPDRVRETVFNWLSPWLHGARCLDLFAGSGAMGLEAASRGAAQVDMVEKAPRVAATLQQAVDDLQADNVRVHCRDALAFLREPPQQPYDVIFLDPPYASNLLSQALECLDARWLAPDGRLYLEKPAREEEPQLPPGWVLVKSKRAGDVGFYLAARQEAGDE